MIDRTTAAPVTGGCATVAALAEMPPAAIRPTANASAVSGGSSLRDNDFAGRSSGSTRSEGQEPLSAVRFLRNIIEPFVMGEFLAWNAKAAGIWVR